MHPLCQPLAETLEPGPAHVPHASHISSALGHCPQHSGWHRAHATCSTPLHSPACWLQCAQTAWGPILTGLRSVLRTSLVGSHMQHAVSFMGHGQCLQHWHCLHTTCTARASPQTSPDTLICLVEPDEIANPDLEFILESGCKNFYPVSFEMK